MSSSTAEARKPKLSNNKKKKIATLLAEAKNAFFYGKLNDAEKAAQEVLKMDADNPAAYVVLGDIMRKVGDAKSAMALLEHAYKIEPDNFDVLNSLAWSYIDNGIFNLAADCFLRCGELKPKNVDVWQNLSFSFFSYGKWNEAVYAAEKGLALAPNHPGLLKNIGLAFHRMTRFDEALTYLQKAWQANPDDVDTLYTIAVVLLEKGDLPAASEAFHQVLEVEPDHANALHYLLLFWKSKSSEGLVQRSEALFDALQGQKGKEFDRMVLAFGLGKAWEDLGDYDKSFSYYDIANHIRRASLEYNIEDDRRDLEELKSIFTRDFFATHASERTDGENFVFIVGMPRSGSTLLEQIIATHPEVVSTGENDMLRQAVGFLGDDGSNRMNMKKISEAKDEAIDKVAKDLIAVYQRLFGDATKYTEKSLPNLWLIGAIRLLFPKAKILHCQRSPLDNCFSIYSNSFAGLVFSYAYDLKELGAYYRLYLDMMEHWRHVLPKDMFYEVSYDALVAEPEQEARKVVEFCGLEWDEACLQFYKKKSAVQTSSLAQVRQPIYKTSVERWRRYEKHLQPLIEVLGDAV